MMFLKIFLLFVVVGVCHGEKCICMSYLISENGLSNENQISSIEYDIEATLCDGNSIMKCKSFCAEMYEELTNNGRTCLIIPGKDSRVGDWMCDSLQRDVTNGRVGVFAQSCGSDVIDTGFRFIENISCKSGYSIHC